MHTIVYLLLSELRDTFRSRVALQLELMALRHQLTTMKRTSPRPLPRRADRLFRVLLYRPWPAWREALVIVKPETVIAWIGKASVCSGPGNRGDGREDGRRFRVRFAS